MEALEQVAPFTTRPSGRIPLPKRQRTKRQRGQSPFTFPVGGSPGGDHDEKVSKTGPLSSTESSEVTRGDEINEEEDMAHCLMLLARGQFRDHEKRQLSVEEDDEEQQEANNDDHHHSKFRSKRFLKTGESVYQCKTCDKVFPSFQALGGHRASHKKPKIAPPTSTGSIKRKNLSPSSPVSASDDEGALPLHLMNTKKKSCDNTSNNGKQLPKLHECLICGAEYSSGQALGGHMRRHRALLTSPALASALTPKTPESQEPLWPGSKAPSLQLDLNLPAPDDDGLPINSMGQERRDRSSLVFSFPALVGCHY